MSWVDVGTQLWIAYDLILKSFELRKLKNQDIFHLSKEFCDLKRLSMRYGNISTRSCEEGVGSWKEKNVSWLEILKLICI